MSIGLKTRVISELILTMMEVPRLKSQLNG